MNYREDLLFAYYQELKSKKHDSNNRGNGTMANIYDDKMKMIRTTLGLLEIHIDGVNR